MSVETSFRRVAGTDYALIINRRRETPFGGAGIDTRRESGFVASHYLWFRRVAGKPAVEALQRAKALPAAYVAGHGYYGSLGPWGAPYVDAGDTLRHCSDTRAAGLRFVGYADDLAGLNHTGWHCDDEGRDTLRGAVWQLPGKGRHARLIYGYQEMEGRREMNEGSAILCISDMRRADMRDAFGNVDESDEARDAARSADSLAEHDAESRRDYNAAYQAGREAAEHDAAALEAHGEALALVASIRAERTAARLAGREVQGTICATLSGALESLLETISAKRAERESAWAAVWRGVDLEPWLAGFMDESSFVRAVRLGYAKATDWKGEPSANPCHA